MLNDEEYCLQLILIKSYLIFQVIHCFVLLIGDVILFTKIKEV